MLILVFMIGVSSCQKEDDSFTKHENAVSNVKSNYKISKIAYETLQQNNRLVTSLAKIKGKGKSNNSGSQNRIVHSNTYGFYIDTDIATYMENEDGSYHSYTFPIFRDNPTVTLENLLFSLQPDGEYKVFIVSYDISESEKEALLFGQYVDLSNKTSLDVIDGQALIDETLASMDNGACTDFFFTYCTGYNDHSDGSTCILVGTGHFSICPTGGGDEGNDGGTDNPDNSDVPDGENNSGGGAPNNPNKPKNATTPVSTIPYAQNLIECLGLDQVENANPTVSEWIYNSGNSDNPDDFDQMRSASQYLMDNGCSPANQSFVLEAIETILEGGKADFPNRVILDESFVDIDKVNCTYQQISKNERIKNLLENFTGEESEYDLKFEVEQNLGCNNANDPSGCTQNDLDSDSSITIKIDEDYINSNETPTLFIARTIIHEAIHANLYLALYNLNNGNPVNLPDINDFSAIYEEYRVYKDWQHEAMAIHYTSLIAQTLQEIHPWLNDQTFIDSLNNDYSDMTLEQFYICIAYLGLNGTIGQSDYLSIPENAINYSISFETAKVNSTKTPNCN